jgi:hypothetical protein
VGGRERGRFLVNGTVAVEDTESGPMLSTLSN